MFNKSFLDTLGESITMEGAMISDKIAIESQMNLQTFHLFWISSAILISYNILGINAIIFR